MPCYTTQKVDIDSGKMHLGTLMDALKAMGLNPRHDGYMQVAWGRNRYNGSTGQMTVVSEEDALAVKRAYANQVVKSQAARFGWSVKAQPDGKLLVMKGKF